MSSLRIAIISESYPPSISGVATFAQQLAQGLAKQGHTVIVCASSLTGRPYVEGDSVVPVYRIRSIPNPWRKKFRLVVRQQRTLNRILGSFNPDVIHAQDPGGCCSAAGNYALKHNVPLIGTYHLSMEFISAYVPFSKLLSANLKPFIQAFCNDFYNDCTVITCPTHTVERDVLKLKMKPPVRVISNGIDTESQLAQIKRTERRESPPSILFVGRIDEDKNLPLLLKAMLHIAPTTKAQLRIVGDGNCLKSYKQWVQRHGLQDSVHFLGSLPSASKLLIDEYSRASIFAMPCLIETQSIVTMEAMVAGLPVVAPRSGALPELIGHGKTGVLVNHPTPQLFAAALESLLENPSLAQKYGLAGREAIKKHSLSNSLTQFVALYREVRAAQPAANLAVFRPIKRIKQSRR